MGEVRAVALPAIRKDIPAYLAELKRWLDETRNAPLEEMAAFFGERLDSYEDHMRPWREAYRAMARMLPPGGGALLDLGCGTGLELDAILALEPAWLVTGVDLSAEMLGRLRQKHPQVRAICGDYFAVSLGESVYDAAVSFETLHHFTPEQKAALFQKVRRALKPGGMYLQAEYVACCPQEEEWLRQALGEKRRREGIAPETFVHFDVPLTAERELALLRGAGFHRADAPACIDGACFLRAIKD